MGKESCMGIAEYIKEQYELNLRKQYESLKRQLEEECFTPDAVEVWKMYGNAFHENTGACKFAKDLLGIDMFDKSGKLNDFDIYLDRLNENMCNYCSAYVNGMKK